MEGFILDFLGPSTNWVLGLSFAAVVLARNKIRKRHLLALVIVTVVAFISFFALLLWGVAGYEGKKSVTFLQTVLKVLAGVVVGCGAAVGFSLILKTVGLASFEDAAPRGTGRRGR